MAGSEDRSLFMFEAARAWGGTGKGVGRGGGWELVGKREQKGVLPNR